jgi:serine/threonine protein kinase
MFATLSSKVQLTMAGTQIIYEGDPRLLQTFNLAEFSGPAGDSGSRGCPTSPLPVMEKYEVKKVVGEGSYGKAVLCKRKADARLCIIKQISIKKLSRKEALLTEQEATLLKRLQHPNIVSFWESFVTSNSLYIVMEYADGGDLDHYIKGYAKAVPRREIPEKQVLHMFVQLALAIKHIHDRKILHRDLKSQVRCSVALATSIRSV